MKEAGVDKAEIHLYKMRYSAPILNNKIYVLNSFDSFNMK